MSGGCFSYYCHDSKETDSTLQAILEEIESWRAGKVNVVWPKELDPLYEFAKAQAELQKKVGEIHTLLFPFYHAVEWRTDGDYGDESLLEESRTVLVDLKTMLRLEAIKHCVDQLKALDAEVVNDSEVKNES